jgi:predicted ATPase/DNA-binding CsgD family transcriptional regulator
MPSKKTKPAGNLPALLSNFIGRTREIDEVKELISVYRLVTISGSGGSGKTRLAFKVADEMAGEFQHGIWIVELAPLSDPGLVLQSIAATFGIHENSGRTLNRMLVEHLLPRQTLLLADNCEHLINPCAVILQELLQACPNLKILATSREVLGVPGEIVWTVPPLSLPDTQLWKKPSSAKEALQANKDSEAICLFLDRAVSASPEFTMTIENGGWIAEICHRLDGMPLAIELAAARVRSLSVKQIAERLDDRFHLLTEGSRTGPHRQQTLAAALDWSYSLLSAKEQRVLQRLSVFAGGATIEAAEAICAGKGVESEEVVDTLSHLVNKSLITASMPQGSEARYRLLETVRQYAREKLEEMGEEDDSKNCLLDYFVNWAEKIKLHPDGPEQLAWLKLFEADQDNIRAALDWSLISAEGANAGLRLATIMGNFWKLHGYHSEGRLRILAALAQKGAQQENLIRAQALFQTSVLAFFQSDYPAVRELAEQSLAIAKKLGITGRKVVADALELLAEAATETGEYTAAPKLYDQALSLYREAGDLVGIGDTLKMLGWGAMRIGDYEHAESLLNEGLIFCRQSGDLRQICSALAGLGELAVRCNQYERASDLLKESLDLSRRAGEKWGIAIALGSLGWVAFRQHDYREMRKLIGESLDVRMETGDRGGMAWCLEKLAEAKSELSYFQPAVIIFGAAFTLRASVGSVMDAADRPDYERLISWLRTELGKVAFEAAWTEGQAMRLEQAIEFALANPELTENDVSLKGKYGGLTGRERETARLIAQGKSNREIANEMTIRVKTVETYVTRILNKLGFDSRVQIATWMIERGRDRKESK